MLRTRKRTGEPVLLNAVANAFQDGGRGTLKLIGSKTVSGFFCREAQPAPVIRYSTQISGLPVAEECYEDRISLC